LILTFWATLYTPHVRYSSIRVEILISPNSWAIHSMKHVRRIRN